MHACSAHIRLLPPACGCRQPEHEAFKALLEAPQAEAKAIARRRFPVPKIVDCDQNGSQVRGAASWGSCCTNVGAASNLHLRACALPAGTAQTQQPL